MIYCFLSVFCFNFEGKKKVSDLKNKSSEGLFSDLVNGFSSAALLDMGYKVDDHVGTPNLDLALLNIKFIKLLKEKTVNNLSDEEQKLINDILHDLDKRYESACKKNRK